MEERSTRRVYIEILTCTAIMQHLEESRSHGNEREAKRALGLGARPPPWVGPKALTQLGSVSWIMLHQPKGLRKTVRLRLV